MPAPKRTTRSTPEPETAREERGKTDTKPIERQTTNAWWCPFCDTSATTLIETCAGCGATRDGDKVTKAGA